MIHFLSRAGAASIRTMDTKPVFPITPPPFSGRSQRAEAGACFEWLRQAWAFFAAYPAVWVGATVLVFVAYFAVAVVPLVGTLAANLLMPALSAGLLMFCKRQANGEEPGLGDLLVGFQGRAASGLILVGAIYGVAMLIIGVIAGLIVGGGVLGGVMATPSLALGVMFGGLIVSLLISAVLATPVLMALWFAPALVLFHDMPPIDAMKASFNACAINWLPLSVYGLLLSVLIFFAILPVGLGLLVLIPILYGTLYASYRDIFPES